VTSRERNPQFCGSPTQLRERSFYQLSETGTTWNKFRSMQRRLCWNKTGISWDHDLQVTSRERNPQFCGSPTQLRERSFYQLSEIGTTWRKKRSMQNRLCWKATGISWDHGLQVTSR
jgi:hypothetical protein